MFVEASNSKAIGYKMSLSLQSISCSDRVWAKALESKEAMWKLVGSLEYYDNVRRNIFDVKKRLAGGGMLLIAGGNER